MNALLVEESPHFLNIREATLFLQDFTTGAEMRKIPKLDAKTFKENPFAYLASRDNGVFNVHVSKPNFVSHTVVFEAGRRLIIDSAVEFPIRLRERILRKCGGEKARALPIGKVREVVF